MAASSTFFQCGPTRQPRTAEGPVRRPGPRRREYLDGGQALQRRVRLGCKALQETGVQKLNTQPTKEMTEKQPTSSSSRARESSGVRAHRLFDNYDDVRGGPGPAIPVCCASPASPQCRHDSYQQWLLKDRSPQQSDLPASPPDTPPPDPDGHTAAA
jgi:hypothetical protein